MKSLYLSRTKTNLKMTDKVLAIIPAAGIGERFQSDIPKQYEYLDGQSVIEKTIKPFIESEFISKILIAVSKSDNFIKEQNFFDNEKVEIVGSYAVPEFGTIAMIILAVAIVSIIAITAKTRTTLIPKL